MLKGINANILDYYRQYINSIIDRASKPAPIITPEFTSSIEDIVKKRILENNFNNITKPEVVQDKKSK